MTMVQWKSGCDYYVMSYKHFYLPTLPSKMGLKKCFLPLFCIRAKVVVFGQKWLFSGKVVVFGHKWLYSIKVVVFGSNWLHSGKVVVSRQKWLCSGKAVVFWQK